ncbi:MAG: hypothetical protein WDA71_10210 [Actinomycetota bacterium]
MTKKATGLLAAAIVIALLASYTAYLKIERRRPPDFSYGGSWGSAATSSRATAGPAAETTGTTASGETTTQPGAAPAVGNKRAPAVKPTSAANPSPAYQAPRLREGTYRWKATGTEQAGKGGVNFCTWDLDEVLMTLHYENEALVADLDFQDGHKERAVEIINADGIWLTFWGISISCSAEPTKKHEGAYDPHLPLLRFPLAEGSTWQSTSTTQGGTVTHTGKVLRKESVTVPAGTFTAWVIENRMTSTGGERSGTRIDTRWFVPELGGMVKNVVSNAVQDGNEHFKTSYTIELSSAPA